MIIVLWTIVSVTWLYIALIHARWSMVTCACIGLTAYSVPALIGKMAPVRFNGQATYFVDTTTSGTLAMAMAWIGFLIALIAPLLTRRHPRPALPSPQGTDGSKIILLSALTISAAMFAYMAAIGGPTFFLKERDAAFALAGEAFTIVRWVYVAGLLAAYHARARLYFLIFASMIVITFMMGDRTIMVISALALAFSAMWNSRLTSKRSVLVILGSAPPLITLALFAKPMYLFLKNPGLGLVYYIQSYTNNSNLLAGFEPFGIHYILEAVIASDLRINMLDLVIPVLGQFLIVPSFFGIETDSYNTLITSALFQGVGYGVAYNPWAQGYSLGGYFGILMFGITFGVTTKLFDEAIDRSKNLSRYFFTIFGVIITFYGHRNSIENGIAFGRQILLACILIIIIWFIFKLVGHARANHRFN